MTSLNSLVDCEIPLVLDTSVLINLHACTYGACILKAFPNDILIPETVATELENETSKARGEHSFLHNLADDGTVDIVAMTNDEVKRFGQLITGTSSLDDGEAATIAIATMRDFLPVIDEKKGRAKATEIAPHRIPCWSFDLLRHPSVLDHLHDEEATNALYLALHNGRMRIPEESCNDVVNLIGIERALECPCLPNYRQKKLIWGGVG